MPLIYIWQRMISVIRVGHETGTPVLLRLVRNGQSTDRPTYRVVLENPPTQVDAETNARAENFLHDLAGILQTAKFPYEFAAKQVSQPTRLLVPITNLPVTCAAVMKDIWPRMAFVQRPNHPEDEGTPTILRFSEYGTSVGHRLFAVTLENNATGDAEANERTNRFLRHLAQKLQQGNFPCLLFPESRYVPLRLLLPVI